MITFFISWLLLSIISLIWRYKTGGKNIDRKWKFVLWTIIILPSILVVYYFDATKTIYEDFLFDLESLKGGL